MDKKRKIYSALFGGLTLFFTLFIFWNSLQTGEESGAQSDAVADLAKKFLGFFGITIEDYSLGVFIRKAAHFSEYFLLCICASLFIINITSRRFSFAAPIYCGIVAICDEFIMQMSTSGRSPQWTDVLIDFCGALVGLGILISILGLKKKKRN